MRLCEVISFDFAEIFFFSEILYVEIVTFYSQPNRMSGDMKKLVYWFYELLIMYVFAPEQSSLYSVLGESFVLLEAHPSLLSSIF